jgi:hypothetical protein
MNKFTHHLRPTVAWLFAAMIFPIAHTGCGKKELPRLTVYPVSGKVFVDGRPAAHAEVTLRPLTELNEPTKRSMLPFGKVAADGGVKIGSYEADDGAPAGEYAITVTWPLVKIEGGEETSGPDQLGGKYGVLERPAAKITVKEGDNTLPPLNLKR